MESLALAAAGGAAGLLLAAWGIQALPSLAPSNLPRLTAVRIDALVVLYTPLAAFATGLMFGVGPALHSAAAVQEFGVRLALGARRTDVLTMVRRRACGLAPPG